MQAYTPRSVHPATGLALPLEGISRGLLPGSPRGGAAADLTMAKSLREWIDSEVRDVRAKPMSWLSQYHFFRDPTRPMWSDTSCFFAPADGIILYEKIVAPHDPIV